MRIVVVGGGIAGLAAAYRLAAADRPVAPDRSGGPGGAVGAGRHRVTVVERSDAPGGKLRTGRLAGVACETGAEAFLTSGPDGGPSAATALAREVGLAGALVHPARSGAAIAVDGALRPVPAGTLLGVPGDPGALDGLARVAVGLDRDGGRPLLPAGGDVAVGALVRARFGDEVVDRLVDPMLGGVYAGHADRISLRMAVPALADAATREHTLAAAVRAATAARRAPAGTPVFSTVDGGLGRLVGAVAARLRAAGVEFRLGLPARELVPVAGGGWRLVVGSTRGPAPLVADAVVLAVPARPAARLLATAGLAGADPVVDYASVALVTLALPAPGLPELSGLLVPGGQGYAVKAATFFGNKWPHQRRADGLALVRASLGRFGEERLLHRTDADLVALARRELAVLLGRQLPGPVDAAVHRWGGALPQYLPGHADRVAALRAGLPPTVAVAGAAYDGVGIPGCVASGYAAADALTRG